MPVQRLPVSRLSSVRVRDCMHPRVFTCTPDDSIRQVATVMANKRVHSVVITDGAVERPVGILTDRDLVTAIVAGVDCTASQAAGSHPLTVSSEESLLEAARQMSEHGVSHAVVLSRSGGYPVGVLSTLDIAALYAKLGTPTT